MSHMEREAREAPEAVARFLDHNREALQVLGARLRSGQTPVVLTSARGSSDQAAGYFKYLTEILLGVPCASMGASVVSVYGAKLRAKGALCLTISQSGKSPDIVALQQAARGAGAFTVALVNEEASPVAGSADLCLPLKAGPEKSVAATKSFIVSLAGGAAIAAQWSGDAALIAAVEALPERLAEACAIAWPEFGRELRGAGSLYVLGRGPTLPVAAETALKLKETCAIHAEAHSVAEVMHGPLELLGEGFPVMAYAPEDAARDSTAAAVARMRMTGARVMVAGAGGWPIADGGHPLLAGITLIQTAYLAIEKLAVARGRDPDAPRLLSKVTETL